MEKETAKIKIQELIKKYQTEKASNRLRHYTEQDTKNGFIEPLFKALGWDVSNRNEVSLEDHIKGSGRSDYNFKINGITQFYLEAKNLKADLDNEEFSFQAINYSWNKGVTYAILTDFEGIKVFNAQRIDKIDLIDKKIFELPYDQYISDFDSLWHLSRDSFRQKELDAYAEKIGKKEKSVQVSTVIKKINEDIQDCREWLTKEFKSWNENLNLSKDVIDEGVQKLLDRLIFLRVAEDREVEPNILKNLLREAEKSKGYEIFKAMSDTFRKLDKIYDSNLFSPHPFESWVIVDQKGFEKMVDKLYGKRGQYEYNFKEMPADVLGTVYENYLNYKLTQSKKGVNVEKDVKKRKEQGIFYTPTFVVDYIVRNALKPVLDNCKSIADLKKIKVLDPACGSGSFLIRALEAIAEKYKEFGVDGSVKRQIILENLFGVDLDMQAVEIARLNLLINSLDSKEILPKLDNNIKNGNSLISGNDKEMEKHFGKNWKDKKPFNWQEEFPAVFEQGGFDVVIGNPPYVGARELLDEDKNYFNKIYTTAKDQYDLYILFIERSINLLRKNGYLSFITPNKFLITKYGFELRKFICKNTILENFKDYSKDNVFPDASVYPVIFILKKIVNKDITVDENYNLLKIFNFDEKNSILLKLNELNNFIKFKVWRPLAASSNIIEGNQIIVSNKEIERYYIVTKKEGSLNLKRDLDVVKNKIIMKKVCFNLEAGLDDIGFYPINTTYCLQPEEFLEINLKYMLGILNSKLFTYFVRNKYAETALGGGFIELRVFQIQKLPILDVSKKEQKIIVDLVDKMISLNKKLHETLENSNEWEKIKSEIEKTDKKIDEEIYKLYDLTPDEVEIINNSGK